MAPVRGAASRRRVFFLSRIFWCFIWQTLQPRTSCRAVVRQVQAWCETERTRIDESNSAYCQARARLPVTTLEQALRGSASAADHLCRVGIPDWTRPVKVVDGSSVRLPDTPANRKAYPYPSGQTSGCGFPVMGFVGLYSLNSGAILNVAHGPWKAHDMRLFYNLWHDLKPGDVLLGDRAFGCFLVLAHFPPLHVDVVARVHQTRCFDHRHAQRIGPSDWRVSWKRPRCRPDYLSQEEWDALPDSITLRIIRVRVHQKGFRTKELWLCTTLLDPIAYPAERIAQLYLRRWDLELCFRDLKTTMGMEALRCQSPLMVHKELLAFLIAHNFIRCLIAQAASAHHVARTRISFKGAVDAARSFYPAMRVATSLRQSHRLYRRLLDILALDLVPLRPNRLEPRAVKLRPKNFPRLTRPRHRFKEIPHRGRPAPKRIRLS